MRNDLFGKPATRPIPPTPDMQEGWTWLEKAVPLAPLRSIDRTNPSDRTLAILPTYSLIHCNRIAESTGSISASSSLSGPRLRLFAIVPGCSPTQD